MYVEVITPDKKLYIGEANLVKLPGANGSFEILKNHAPIISLLTEGDVKIISSNNDIVHIGITGGMAEVNDNKVIILASGQIETEPKDESES